MGRHMAYREVDRALQVPFSTAVRIGVNRRDRLDALVVPSPGYSVLTEVTVPTLKVKLHEKENAETVIRRASSSRLTSKSSSSEVRSRPWDTRALPR